MRSPLLAVLFSLSAIVCCGQDAGQLITDQWITVDNSGRFRAAVLPPFGSTSSEGGRVWVSLLTADGAVLTAEPAPDSETELIFSDVPTGVHTLVAHGADLVAMYAVHVSEGGAPRKTFLISAGSLAPKKVLSIAARYLPAHVDFAPSYDPVAAEAVVRSQRLQQTTRVQQTGSGIMGRVLRAGFEGSKLSAGGENNVLIYRERDVIAQVVTDPDGTFKIDELEPGSYAVAVAGPDGFAITGFDVEEVGLAAASVNRDGGNRLVSTQVPQGQTHFEIQLAAIGLHSPAMDLLEQAQNQSSSDSGLQPSDDALAGVPTGPNQPMSGAPFGGGGGGGSGGSLGGGGGLGGLLGLGAVGGILAVASSDDDDVIAAPPVASPINP